MNKTIKYIKFIMFVLVVTSIINVPCILISQSSDFLGSGVDNSIVYLP